MEPTYKPSNYNLWYKGENGNYLYNVFTTGLLSLNHEYLTKIENVLKHPSEIASFSEEEKTLLIENGFLVAENVDEIDMVKFRYRKSVFDKSRLNVTLIPTKACNLACSYCFEHQKPNLPMTQEDCSNILKFFEHEFQEIRPYDFHVYWYGGEPLLVMDIIETISKGITEICEKLGIKRSPDSMVTNGYLLYEDTALKLKELGVNSMQISLDGDPEEHDRRRILKNGTGTFKRLHEAIDIARNHFERLTVRINTNKSNLPGIMEMLKTDPIFKEKNVIANIGPLKTYLGGKITKAQDIDCFRGTELQKVQLEVDNLFNRNFIAEGPGTFFTKGNNCGADQYKSFVIGPGALVYKCYERVDPGEDVGQIKNGVFVPNHNYWKWVINEPFKHQACRDCLYLPVCMGGCPAVRMRLGVPNSESCGYWEEWLKIKLQKIDQANQAK